MKLEISVIQGLSKYQGFGKEDKDDTFTVVLDESYRSRLVITQPNLDLTNKLIKRLKSVTCMDGSIFDILVMSEEEYERSDIIWDTCRMNLAIYDFLLNPAEEFMSYVFYDDTKSLSDGYHFSIEIRKVKDETQKKYTLTTESKLTVQADSSMIVRNISSITTKLHDQKVIQLTKDFQLYWAKINDSPDIVNFTDSLNEYIPDKPSCNDEYLFVPTEISVFLPYVDNSLSYIHDFYPVLCIKGSPNSKPMSILYPISDRLHMLSELSELEKVFRENLGNSINSVIRHKCVSKYVSKDTNDHINLNFELKFNIKN